MAGRRRFAAVIFTTMLAIYVPMVVAGVAFEAGGNPAIGAMGVNQATGLDGGERIPIRLRPVRPVGDLHNGHVERLRQRHARFAHPFGRTVADGGMWLNTVFGGVGVGFINMLIFVIVAVFIAGMMIGRTPELLGKKVEGAR